MLPTQGGLSALRARIKRAAGTGQSDTALGSSASCNPSPKKLKAMTVMKIIRPGQTMSCGARDMSSWAQVSNSPQP